MGDDTLCGVNRRRKGTANSLAALKRIRAAGPEGRICVVLDNLSAHKAPTIVQWAQSHAVEL